MPDPQWWLTHLTARMDNRAPRVTALRRRLEGDAPLPEGADNCREAYVKLQRKARSNYEANIVSAVTNRMTIAQFRVGDNREDDNRARKLWKRNKANTWYGDVHREMVGLSEGFVAVQPGDFGAEFFRVRPEQAIVEYDPVRPDKRRAALIAVRDFVSETDLAYLHLVGRVWRFTRPAFTTDSETERRKPITSISGGWTLDETYSDAEGRATSLSRIPVVPFVNRGGLGEFEAHVDLLDRINWTTLQRMVLTAMQAFRQRAVKGDLPEKDEAGKPIDYEKIFQPGPGALWNLPEGVDIWESAQTDLRGILDSAKADLTELSGVTNTPMMSLMPEGANQTAEGAATSKEGLVFKVRDINERAGSSWAEVLSLGIEMETQEVVDVEVDFVPPENQSMAERFDALAKSGTDVPWRTKMTDILGFDGDKVDRMAAERAEDAVFAASFAPAPPASPGAPQTAPATEEKQDGGEAGSTDGGEPRDSSGRPGSSAG
ncbi:phage portal protein [Amycolatopsis sp. NPDC003731]